MVNILIQYKLLICFFNLLLCCWLEQQKYLEFLLFVQKHMFLFTAFTLLFISGVVNDNSNNKKNTLKLFFSKEIKHF